VATGSASNRRLTVHGCDTKELVMKEKNELVLSLHRIPLFVCLISIRIMGAVYGLIRKLANVYLESTGTKLWIIF